MVRGMAEPVSVYEAWRDRCRLAAAAASARGDELAARYLASLALLNDDQVAGVCLLVNHQESQV